MSMTAEGMQAKVTLEDVLAELRAIRAELSLATRKMPAGPMTPAEFAKVVGKSKKWVERRIASGALRAKATGTRGKLIRPVDAKRFLGGGK